MTPYPTTSYFTTPDQEEWLDHWLDMHPARKKNQQVFDIFQFALDNFGKHVSSMNCYIKLVQNITDENLVKMHVVYSNLLPMKQVADRLHKQIQSVYPGAMKKHTLVFALHVFRSDNSGTA